MGHPDSNELLFVLVALILMEILVDFVEDPRTRHRGHNGQGIKLLRDDCDCYMEPKPDEDAHVP